MVLISITTFNAQCIKMALTPQVDIFAPFDLFSSVKIIYNYLGLVSAKTKKQGAFGEIVCLLKAGSSTYTVLFIKTSHILIMIRSCHIEVSVPTNVFLIRI